MWHLTPQPAHIPIFSFQHCIVKVSLQGRGADDRAGLYPGGRTGVVCWRTIVLFTGSVDFISMSKPHISGDTTEPCLCRPKGVFKGYLSSRHFPPTHLSSSTNLSFCRPQRTCSCSVRGLEDRLMLNKPHHLCLFHAWPPKPHSDHMMLCAATWRLVQH